jgi:excisionase family DNA binding protein
VALGISQPTLTKLVREGKVRSVKIRRTRLIEKTEVDAYLARAQTEPVESPMSFKRLET